MKGTLFAALILYYAALLASAAEKADSITKLPAAPLACSSDWLIAPVSQKAVVCRGERPNEIMLDNGLARRVFRLAPNAATISMTQRGTGEEFVRSVRPEAVLRIQGKEIPVGGLVGQKLHNYLKPEWLDGMTADPAAARFVSFSTGPTKAPFPWKKRTEWMPQDLPWPPPGVSLVLSFELPSAMTIDVHYELYDGVPLFCKWLTVRNKSQEPVRLERVVSEILSVVEAESSVEANVRWEQPNLLVETDYAYLAFNAKSAINGSVRWKPDPSYPTQVNYNRQTPCLLECAPEFGPNIDLPPGGEFTSIRTYELLLDGTDRERRGLSQRRMYRTIAPWVTENPIIHHLLSNNPTAIRAAVDQCAAVGFELIILSFGSGFNFESRDPKYMETFRQVSDYARSKNVAIGGYSLLASRGAGVKEDNCQPGRIRFGVMPCLGSTWGREYLAQLQRFLETARLGVLEHDGSYPGDTCASQKHPGHRGLDDSQWVQWKAITDFYKWCRANGVYLNIPDWYFLSGGSKTGMGYRETNWSLPRDEQVIIERQNIFDGTWEKTPSMGWMFVPLTQYHGGGAAATIEPLDQHRDHYEARLADLFGAGVQACWRGPRLYDTDATRDLVKGWVDFYTAHRAILDSDIIHLRRPDGRDWDGILHVNPRLSERGLAMFFNPLGEPMVRTVRLPVYYTGLKDRAVVRHSDGAKETIAIGPAFMLETRVAIPASGNAWLVLESAAPE